MQDSNVYDTFPWCSTMVDEFGVHVSGVDEWGKCDPDNCPSKMVLKFDKNLPYYPALICMLL